MTPRFRLRTALTIFTAFALSLGGNLAANRFAGIRPEAAGATWLLLRGLGSAPVFLVASIGIVRIWDRRRACPQASRLALSALTILIIWHFAVPLVISAFYASTPSLESAKWAAVAVPLVSSIMSATCWGLMIAAFLRAVSEEQRCQEPNTRVGS